MKLYRTHRYRRHSSHCLVAAEIVDAHRYLVPYRKLLQEEQHLRQNWLFWKKQQELDMTFLKKQQELDEIEIWYGTMSINIAMRSTLLSSTSCFWVHLSIVTQCALHIYIYIYVCVCVLCTGRISWALSAHPKRLNPITTGPFIFPHRTWYASSLWGQMGPNCQVALYLWSAWTKLYEIWPPTSLQTYKAFEKLKWHWYGL